MSVISTSENAKLNNAADKTSPASPGSVHAADPPPTGQVPPETRELLKAEHEKREKEALDVQSQRKSDMKAFRDGARQAAGLPPLADDSDVGPVNAAGQPIKK